MAQRPAARVCLPAHEKPFPGDVHVKGSVEFSHMHGRGDVSFYPCRPAWDAHAAAPSCKAGFYNVSYQQTTRERHRPTPQLTRDRQKVRTDQQPSTEATIVNQQPVDVTEAFRRMQSYGHLKHPPPCGDMFGNHCFGRSGRQAPPPTQEQKEERVRLYELESRRLRQEEERRPLSAGAARTLDFSRHVGRRRLPIGTPRLVPQPPTPASSASSGGSPRPPTSASRRRPVTSLTSRTRGVTSPLSDGATVAGTGRSAALRRRQKLSRAERNPRLLTFERQQRRTMRNYEWLPDSYPSTAAALRVDTPAGVSHRQKDRHVASANFGSSAGRTAFAPRKSNAAWLHALLKQKARLQQEQESILSLGDATVPGSTFGRGAAGSAPCIFLAGGRHDIPVQGRKASDGGASAQWAQREATALSSRVVQDAKTEKELARKRRLRIQARRPPGRRPQTATTTAATAAGMDEACGRAYRIFSPSHLAKVAAENSRYAEAPMGASSYGINLRQARNEQLQEEAAMAGVREALAAAGADKLPTPTQDERPNRRMFSKGEDA